MWGGVMGRGRQASETERERNTETSAGVSWTSHAWFLNEENKSRQAVHQAVMAARQKAMLLALTPRAILVFC